MLQQFTWQQFLIAALILTLIWYLGVFLLYYRHRATALLSPKTRAKEPERLQREWEQELEDEDEVDGIGSESPMGRPAEPEGVSTVSMDSIRFSGKSVGNDSYRDEQLGLVPDVLQELKGIFERLEKEDGDKAHFFSLIELVKEKYPKISSTGSLEEINRYIRDHVLFPLSDEELEDLWD